MHTFIKSNFCRTTRKKTHTRTNLAQFCDFKPREREKKRRIKCNDFEIERERMRNVGKIYIEAIFFF